MEIIPICTVNGALIQVSNDELMLVPIKPICEALGVTYESQAAKLREHPTFSSTMSLIDMVGADGKIRKMTCLPAEDVMGWVYTIHPDKVAPEVREALIRYQKECNHAIFQHYFGRLKKQSELDRQELECIKKKDEAQSNYDYHKDQMALAKSVMREMDLKIAQLSEQRRNHDKGLFDDISNKDLNE